MFALRRRSCFVNNFTGSQVASSQCIRIVFRAWMWRCIRMRAASNYFQEVQVQGVNIFDQTATHVFFVIRVHTQGWMLPPCSGLRGPRCFECFCWDSGLQVGPRLHVFTEFQLSDPLGFGIFPTGIREDLMIDWESIFSFKKLMAELNRDVIPWFTSS